MRILEKDSDMPAWLWTATFYDTYGREIQTQADNHLNGIDITGDSFRIKDFLVDKADLA